MDNSNKYDIIIIGGGPIGLACGIEAKKAGLSYIILEKGCLVNSLYHYPANMTFFSTSERLEIGNTPFISHGDKPTRSEALEYYRRVQQGWRLQVNLYEKVEKVSAGTVARFQVKSNKAVYEGESVIVATGFYDKPNLMNVPGEDLQKVKHYYNEPHPYANQKVLVVGAANSAVDVALETYRKGAEVTMLVRGEAISRRVKYWIKPDIDNRIKEGSIKAYFNSELKAIREHEVDIQAPEGLVTIPNNFVLAMTGYQPDFSFLQNIGIVLCDDGTRMPFHNEETYESNVHGLYVAGVVCGGMVTSKWFIENSREHAEIVVKKIQEEAKAAGVK